MNNKFRNLLVLILFFVLNNALYAQFNKGARMLKSTKTHKEYAYSSSNSSDTIDLDFEVTSLVISIDYEGDFTDSYIISGTDTFQLFPDHEQIADDGKGAGKTYYSNLIIFNKPIKSFIFIKGKLNKTFNFHFLNSGATPKIESKGSYHRTESCGGALTTIDQSVWRKGLAPPTSAPTYTKVKHVIIHHAAGSNSNTDFTSVVRQIYLYHVDVRKYSDVAYNFLIAQDGTIYQGREGTTENEDNVTGAHFCAKNSGTMGICLLGNYETAIPPAKMLSSLEELIAWKLKKENLDPFGSSLHPLNSSTATSLGTIDGHRAGCSTDCPGKNVFTKLNEIKQNVSKKGPSSGGGLEEPKVIRNTRKGPGRVTLEVSGGPKFIWATTPNLKDSIPGARSKTYTTGHLVKDSIFFVASKDGDCLSAFIPVEAIIEINVEIYPNPAIAEVKVMLNESSKNYTLSLVNSLGQTIYMPNLKVLNNTLSFDVSTLPRGIYFLRFNRFARTYSTRLLVGEVE